MTGDGIPARTASALEPASTVPLPQAPGSGLSAQMPTSLSRISTLARPPRPATEPRAHPAATAPTTAKYLH